jgi:prohibitin 1
MEKYFILLSFLFTGCTMVGPQDRAVHTYFGRAVSESGSGPSAWFPFVYGVTKFDLSVQKHTVETTASSKDLQPLDSHIAVNWRIDPTNVTGFYKDVGDENDAVIKLIDPAVNEVFKSATAKLTAEEVISRRIDLKKEIDTNLQLRLAHYGLHIDDVSIIDVKFSDQFIQAIESKQIAEQQKEQAHYLADKAKVDAEASVNQARGQADSQRLLQTSLTPAMIQKLALDKWDGHFPQVMGAGTLPFLDLSKMK